MFIYNRPVSIQVAEAVVCVLTAELCAVRYHIVVEQHDRASIVVLRVRDVEATDGTGLTVDAAMDAVREQMVKEDLPITEERA